MAKYWKTNQRWLRPAIGGLMIAIVQMTLPAGAGSMPDWLPLTALALACFASVLGAMRTDTTSAYLVQFVGTAAGFAFLLHAIFN